MPRRDDCRGCGGKRLTRFLDLGATPLANRFLRREQLDAPEPTFPLDVFVCADCSLVQLCEVVDPELLFRDYVYVSGTSETMRRHFAALADQVATRYASPGALVVEIASNDGTLLSAFGGRDVRVLGVEPATNIAELARRRGIDTLNEFFGAGVGRRIAAERGAAKIVIANNVLAHVDRLDDFVGGVRELLAPDGVFVFEASYVLPMLDRLEFDSVYHEHLCYFSVTALTALMARFGLELFDVESHPVHGGSLRGFAQRAGGPRPRSAAIDGYLHEEEARGVKRLETYEGFSASVYRLRDRLVGMLRELRQGGARLVGYGSPAKGNTLLNFMRIGPEFLDYLVDKSELKQGLFAPGTHLPVHPPRRLVEDRPDYALLLAWNFTDEVIAQQQEYLRAGGKFIVPIPEPRIIGA